MSQVQDRLSLHEACYLGRIDIVAQLLAGGADPNEAADPNEREWISCAGNRPKPLNCVAIAWILTENHVKIASMLIEHAAVVDNSVIQDHICEMAGSPTDMALRQTLDAAR